jgi:hypothetical protein
MKWHLCIFFFFFFHFFYFLTLYRYGYLLGVMFFFSEEMVTRLGKARRGCQGVAGKFVFVGCDVFVFFFLSKGFLSGFGVLFCY